MLRESVSPFKKRCYLSQFEEQERARIRSQPLRDNIPASVYMPLTERTVRKRWKTFQIREELLAVLGTRQRKVQGTYRKETLRTSKLDHSLQHHPLSPPQRF